jgi:hypothetical protein
VAHPAKAAAGSLKNIAPEADASKINLSQSHCQKPRFLIAVGSVLDLFYLQ